LETIGEKLEEIIDIINCHLQPFNRGGEVTAVEAIAVLMVGGGFDEVAIKISAILWK
jgi:hypothetical protein